MKRNVILSGGNTHLISLPFKWIQKYGIKKGDELELLEENNKLTISTTKVPERKSINLNLKNTNIALIVRNITNYYQLGFSDLYLTFDKKSLNEKTTKKVNTSAVIQDTCDQLVGFEILEQKDTSCRIKDVAGNDINEFKNILRRLFLMINSFGEDLIKYINNYEELTQLHRKHIMIRKYISYCQRYLNLKGIANKTSQYNELVVRLLDISRTYRFISKNQINKKNSYSSNVLTLLKETVDLQREFYELFYTFSNEKASQLTKKRVEIFKKINKLNVEEEDLILLHRVTPILNTILSLTTVCIAINFES